jgi:short-subunit dehydrogenase
MTSVPSVGTTGIGSVYTDLFAKRIHHLILAVRHRTRKEWSTNVED